MVSDSLAAVDWGNVHLLAAAVTFLVALAVVWAVDRPGGEWGRRLRSRLLLGVPWGTLVAVALVVCVYLFVQSGIDNVNRPVVIPFRAWSYFYLEGMLFSGFAHASLSHVTGNLLSALVAGTIAEYAYGHFPRERGSSSFGSFRTNPYVRAFCFVPAAIVVASLLSALFALGPVIGFSGTVFALWGFALVHYPIKTIAALIGATLVNVAYETLRNPITFAEASSSYGPPSWANVAVQGHAIGLFMGVLAALYLVQRRDARRPTALYLFAGVLLFGASRRLWAIYWYLGNEQYVLYRAGGLALVVLLALLVAVAGAGRANPIVERWAVPDPESLRGALGSASPRAIGLVLLVMGAGIVAGPAILPNLTTVSDEPLPGDPIEVEGYEVTYAEDVTDGMVNVVDVEAFGRSTAVNTSGVIVRNEERGIWTTAVTRGNLAHWGHRTVDVGGTGWRESVTAHRQGWRAVGGPATYRVDLIHDGERRTAFVSDPSESEVRVDGRNVTVAAVEGGFELRVEHGDETATAPLPAREESVTLAGVEFVREENRVYAERGETRVRVATQETYQGRQ